MEKKIGNYIYGRRNIEELLNSLLDGDFNSKNFPIREVYVKSTSLSELKKTTLKHLPAFVKVLQMDQKELDRLLPNVNHQGVIGLRDPKSSFKILGFREFSDQVEANQGPILVLDRIQDPGNLGGILRTAECLGVQHVLLSDRETADINATVERVSSGALHFLKVYRFQNLAQGLEILKERDYWICALDEEGEEDWSELPPKENLVVLFGNEGEGLKRILMEKSDYPLRIPLYGRVSSLNVGVAVGITLDRIVRDSPPILE